MWDLWGAMIDSPVSNYLAYMSYSPKTLSHIPMRFACAVRAPLLIWFMAKVEYTLSYIA